MATINEMSFDEMVSARSLISEKMSALITEKAQLSLTLTEAHDRDISISGEDHARLQRRMNEIRAELKSLEFEIKPLTSRLRKENRKGKRGDVNADFVGIAAQKLDPKLFDSIMNEAKIKCKIKD